MKKILLMGRTGCGKTTLTQRINGEDIEYRKTQMLTYSNNILDSPGEYMENSRLYRALIVSSYDCDVIGLVHAIDEERNYFPPGFSSAFTKPSIGIITKADLPVDLRKAEEVLRNAGAEKVFVISSYEDRGIDELIRYLEGDDGKFRR